METARGVLRGGRKVSFTSQMRDGLSDCIPNNTKSRKRPPPRGKQLPTKEYFPEERQDKFIYREKEVRYCIMFSARFVG
jgi:hypothetical protein